MKNINCGFELPNLTALRLRYSVDGKKLFHYGQLSLWKEAAQIKKPIGEYYTLEDIHRLDTVFIAVRLLKVGLVGYKKIIDSNTTLEKWVERSYGFTLLAYLQNLPKDEMGSHPSVRNIIKILLEKEFIKSQRVKAQVGKDFVK